MRQASVCTGLGAAELAATWLGWENVFMSEIDDFCRKVLSYHFPKAKLHGDFTKEDFRQYKGQIDVLTAGFPCQPFSVSGERRGADDHRYLWPHVFRLVDEIRPPWFIGENVAGLTSMVFPGDEIEVESQSGLFETADKETILEEQHILRSICNDLESIGYSVQPIIVPACAVGAPHRRDRIFIVANRSDAGIEGLQQERKDGICQSKALANSECERGRQVFEEIQSQITDGNGSNGFSCERTLTNARGKQSQNRTQECNSTHREEGCSGVDGWLERSCDAGTASDSTSKQSERVEPRQQSKTGEQKQMEHRGGDSENVTSRFEMPDFRDFPTQSPICSRNDGLSGKLDGITFSSWRTESVKAYGNAIVPQVLYQILEIINRIENNRI